MQSITRKGPGMAAMPVLATSTTGASTLRQRLWVRRDPPVWPFVWRGLLPLLGLSVLAAFGFTAFARNDVETNVREGVRRQLDASGAAWARVAVSGQQVQLSGSPPAPSDADAALGVARAAQCATWNGPKTCAIEVTGAFDALKGSSAQVATVATTANPAPVRASPAAAQACEKTWAGLLAGSNIEFETGSAAIRPDSAALLDRLAKAVGECPGSASIEGHTDSVGLPASNQALSEARAAAVRDALRARGVAAEKLSAKGFGDTRPIAENTSSAGRRQNRRIEFKANP
jgi:outer membrane protein OmpA-like peptidoglycan-associated protein